MVDFCILFHFSFFLSIFRVDKHVWKTNSVGVVSKLKIKVQVLHKESMLKSNAQNTTKTQPIFPKHESWWFTKQEFNKPTTQCVKTTADQRHRAVTWSAKLKNFIAQRTRIEQGNLKLCVGIKNKLGQWQVEAQSTPYSCRLKQCVVDLTILYVQSTLYKC